MRGVLGIFLLLAVAWALGEWRHDDRERRIPWRTVVAGLMLQIVLAVLLLRFPPVSHVLLLLNRAALALQEATDRGTAFVFGYLGGGALPFIETAPGASFILAFKVLPPVVPSEDSAEMTAGDEPTGACDALVKGTRDGVAPLVGIITVLVVAVALVALVNMALGRLPGDITLQGLFALVFRPVMWLIGVPWAESAEAASLMGTKTVLNAFVAYLDLAKLPDGAVGPRSRLIVTYALCGFANFGSLGILVGGMGAMVPERRREITELGLRSIASGTIATCMSGAIAGLLHQ